MLFHIGRRLSGGLPVQAASLSSAQLNLLKEKKMEIPAPLKQKMRVSYHQFALNLSSKITGCLIEATNELAKVEEEQ